MATHSFALHDPINASPDLAAHGGRKEGRLTQIGSITRRSTDRLGGWQSSTCRWSSDDHDRVLRGLQRSNRWYGREFRAYVGDRTDLANSRCLGRFNIREHPPTPGFGVTVEGTDVIGSEFSAFNLDRDILDSYIFDLVRFPAAPQSLLDANQPVPAYMGKWSDEGSETGVVPVLAGVVSRGSWAPTEPGSSFRVGFDHEPATAPAPATTASLGESGGGSLNLGVAPYNAYYFQVWPVTAGVQGDPYPFYPEQIAPFVITGNSKNLVVNWTFGGTDPTEWRVAIAVSYYGARWVQQKTVAGNLRTVTFDNVEWNGVGAIATGAVAPEFWGRKEFKVVANMSDGVTGASTPGGMIPYGGPNQRRAYVSWNPVSGALSYDVYLGDVPADGYFGWRRKVTVSADDIDADGFNYYVYNWDTPGVAVDGIETPEGMLPLWDTGDVTFDGDQYAQLVLCRWAVHSIIGVYANGARLADNHTDLRHPDHPSWPGPSRVITIGGWDTTVVYVRVGSSLLEAHRDGTALIQVNACTTEDIGDGNGSTLTQAARVVQFVITELVFNDHATGVWAGIPLYADGVPMIRSSVFAAAETMQIARVGGTGYTARMALVQPTTLRELIQNIVQSFGLHLGINHHGQVVCGHYDDSIDTTAGYPHYKDIREIVGHIRVDPRTRELENRIPYQHDFRPIGVDYAAKNLTAENTTSIAAYLGKPRIGQLRSMPYAADQITVDDGIQRLLLLGSYVREWVEVPVSIVGLDDDVDLFKIIAVTDEEGTGASGYIEEFILLLEIEVVPAKPDMDTPTTLVLKGLNITPLADAAWVWGPDTITSWDTMTEEEKGIYGAWASESNVIPAANDPAKEWR